jgi:hypothetical protein
MLDYNVPGGKLNRGMAVYDVIAAIKGADVSARGGRPIWLGRCLDAAGRRAPCPAPRLVACVLPPRPGPRPRPHPSPRFQSVSSTEAFRANALGWCIELVRGERVPRCRRLLAHTDCSRQLSGVGSQIGYARAVITPRYKKQTLPTCALAPSCKLSSWWRTT